MSANYLNEGEEPPSVPTSGRIITQNPAYLDMLRENTLEDHNTPPTRKVYVDSDVLEKSDDGKYRFVSEDVDDFDDNHDMALQVDSLDAAEEEDQGRGINEEPFPVDGERESRISSNMSQSQPYKPQYVISSAGSRKASDLGSRKGYATASSSKGDEDEDEEELRKEMEYQALMKQRLQESEQQADSVYIPKLDLTESDDDDAKKLSKDSLDIDLRDSLDYASEKGQDDAEVQEEAQPDTHDSGALQDSLEWNDPPTNPYLNVNSQQPSGEPSEYETVTPSEPQYYHQPPGEQSLPTGSEQHYDDPQYYRQPPGEQSLPTGTEQHYDDHPAHQVEEQYQGPDPRFQQVTEPRQMAYKPGPEQSGQYGYGPKPDHDHPYSSATGAEYGLPYMAADPNMYHQPQAYYADSQAQPASYKAPEPAFENEDTMNDHYQQNSYRKNSQDPRYVDQFTAKDLPSRDTDSATSSPRRVKVKLKPWEKIDTNHIDKNKKHIGKQISTSSYGKLYVQKKNEQKQTKVPSTGGSRKTMSSKPAVLSSENGESATSAEMIWQQRAKSLTLQKQEKLSDGKKKNKVPLRKYPSESRVDLVKPHHVDPMPVPTAQQSFTEPVKSEMVRTPRGPGLDDSLTHTIYTENGQKFSVDINLKVVSPGPGNAPNQRTSPRPIQPTMRPLGPAQNQQGAPPSYREHYQPARQVAPPRGQYGPPQGYSQHMRHPLPREAFVYQQQHAQQRAPLPAQQTMPNQFQHRPHYNLQSLQQGQLPHYQQQYSVEQQYDQQQYQQDQQYIPLQQYEFIGHQQAAPMHMFQRPQDQQYQQQGPAEESPVSGKPPTPLGSPFKVLPPIGSADSNKGHQDAKPAADKSPRRPPEDPGSYMNSYLEKKNKKPEYKEYGLNDWRRMKQQELKLGGLGPDLDSETMREKREKMLRQQEYARQIGERNRQAKEQMKGKLPRQHMREQEEVHEVLDRRTLALEYARNVPKPKAQPKKVIVVDSTPRSQRSGVSSVNGGRGVPNSGHSQRSVASNQPSPSDQQSTEMVDLAKLKERHEQEKQKAAMIRNKMEAGVPAH